MLFINNMAKKILFTLEETNIAEIIKGLKFKKIYNLYLICLMCSLILLKDKKVYKV